MQMNAHEVREVQSTQNAARVKRDFGEIEEVCLYVSSCESLIWTITIHIVTMTV